MSEYEDTIDGCNRICPYCRYEHQVESKDYSEDIRKEECDECGKKYYAYESFCIDCCAGPDCELNGDEHQWKSEKLTSGRHDFCFICGKCRPID